MLASDSCRSDGEKRSHSSHTCPRRLSFVDNDMMVVGLLHNCMKILKTLISKDLCYLCVVWLDRWVFTKFWVRVLIVYIVTNANEFLATVRAGYQHYSHANSVAFRYQTSVWGIRLSTKHKRYSSINMNANCIVSTNPIGRHVHTQTHNYWHVTIIAFCDNSISS